MSADEPQAGDFVPEEGGAVEALRRFPEQEDGGLMREQAGQDKDGRWIGCGGCVVSSWRRRADFRISEAFLMLR